MEDFSVPISPPSEPWAPPTVRVTRASTSDGEFSVANNHGGPVPLGRLNTCHEPAVLRVGDSAGTSGSESGQSDFATIITVDDLGFGASWPRQVQEYSSSAYAPPPPPPPATDADKPKSPDRDMYLDTMTLTSVGEQFPSSSTVPPGSPQEMVKSFDKDLGEEIEDHDKQADDVTPDQLYSRLWDSVLPSKHTYSNNCFVPQDQLLNTVGNANVMSLLRNTFPRKGKGQLHDMYNEICGEDYHRSRRMILATLVMINQVAYIEDFIREDIRDNHIPLTPYHDNHLCVHQNAFHKRNDGKWTPPVISFREWQHRELRAFFDNQYRVLAPFFDIGGENVCFYKLDSRITLPFLEYSREQNGGHGSVWKVKIHPAHHNFRGEESDPNPYFAIKAIYSEDYERYRDEVRVLERWSGSTTGHAHLIQLLMAFQHGTKFYLLFPWARGNLVNLWKSDPIPSKSLKYIRWIIKQCLGIADGLRKIHHHRSWSKVPHLGGDHQGGKNLGRHGDIKPENILWFNPNDCLVIADFGLTRFHSPETIAETTPGRLHGISLTYRPPEADLDAPLLQRYDVWSLGCLYLEFITWYLVGYEKTRGEDPGSFNQERILDDKRGDRPYPEDKFFNIQPVTSGLVDFHADVKNSVRNWIFKLRALKECSECISDFLDMIETKMLVPDPRARDEMKQVYRTLKGIEERCRTTDYYGVSRAQEPSSRRSSCVQPAIGKLRHSMAIHNHPGQEKNLDSFLEKELERLIQESNPKGNQATSSSYTRNDAGIERGSIPVPSGSTSLVETEIMSAGRSKSDRRTERSLSTTPRLPFDDTTATNQGSLFSEKGTISSSITTPSLGSDDSPERHKISRGDRDREIFATSGKFSSMENSLPVNGTTANRTPLAPIPSAPTRGSDDIQTYHAHSESLGPGPTLSPLTRQAPRSTHSAASNTECSYRTSESQFRRGSLSKKETGAMSEEARLDSVDIAQPILDKSYRKRIKAKLKHILKCMLSRANGKQRIDTRESP